MAGGSSGNADQVSQLVERAEGLGTGPGDRSRRVACLVDGEFSVDPAGERRTARRTKANRGSGNDPAAGCKSAARLFERWQLGRPLSARRRGDDENLACRY